jgi:hypothetical protein
MRFSTVMPGHATNERAAPAKRFLDIEAALRWAYRDELPKRQHGGRYDSRKLDGGMLVSAEHVRANAQDDEDRGREPGFPAALGDPHPDSIVIETAVKHLASWAGYRFGGDRMDALTCGIPLDGDPGLVAMEAIASMCGIVAINARMATRPKWSFDVPTPRWTTGKNGVPKVLVDETFVQVTDRRGRVFYEPAQDQLAPDAVFYRAAIASPPTRGGVYREGTYCPILWRPDPVRLLTERAEHCAWHVALEILAAELEGQLGSIAVLSPAAAWAPWLNSHEDIHGQPPELFAGLREAPYRCETREQAAARRRTAQRRTLHDAEDTRRRPLAGKGARGCGQV